MLSSRQKLLFTLLVISITGGTIALLQSNVKDIHKSATIPPSPWALTTDSITVGRVQKGFPALGKAVSSSEVRIVPQIAGTILDMGPRAGGNVHKGDLLLRIDTRTLEAQASALEAKLTSAIAAKKHNNNELLREKHLLKEGGSSASAVEQRQIQLQSDIANVHSLRKELEAIKVKISYGTINSPINGQVSKRLAEAGDTVLPGKTVYTLTASQGGRVIVPIPLNTLTQIVIGGEVELSINKQKMLTYITRINPSLDALSMGSLEIDLPQRPFNLPDGAPIAAKVITASQSGLTVLVRALLPSSNKNDRKLFKVLSGIPHHIKLMDIQIMLCGEIRCVIQGDLQVGEQVITAHQSVLLQLHDGDLVIIPEQEQ